LCLPRLIDSLSVGPDAGGPDDGRPALDLALEGGFGVEYFFTDRISISGATGLAFRITGIGGTGSLGVKIDTGTTGLYVNFYF